MSRNPSHTSLACCLVLLSAACTVHTAVAQSSLVTLTVPGTSDPWLAGTPAGTIASCYAPGSSYGCDTAPAESPVLVPLALQPGSTLSITASGMAGYGPTAAYQSGPDGCCFIQAHNSGAENGVPAFSSLINSLLGVFVGPAGKQIFVIGSSKIGACQAL